MRGRAGVREGIWERVCGRGLGRVGGLERQVQGVRVPAVSMTSRKLWAHLCFQTRKGSREGCFNSIFLH